MKQNLISDLLERVNCSRKEQKLNEQFVGSRQAKEREKERGIRCTNCN